MLINKAKSAFLKPIAFIVVFTLLLVFAWCFDIAQYFDLEILKAKKDALMAWQSIHPLRFIAILFVGYCLATAIAVPGVTIFFTLASGAFLGLFWGTVLASFASAIGSTLGFLMARYLLSSWVEQQFPDQVQKINQGVMDDGPWYLLSMRLLPIIPFFLINIVMAVTCMKTIVFYLVTQLGMLPGKIVYVNAGTQLEKIESVNDLASPLLIVSLCVMALLPWLARLFVKRLGLKSQL